MKNSFVLILILFCVQLVCAQNNSYKYLYIQISEDTAFSKVKPTNNIKIRDLKNKWYAENKEKGLFKIKVTKLKKISMEIDGRNIVIDLTKETKNKFFEISVFIPPQYTIHTKIEFIKGDLTRIIAPKQQPLNIVRIKFPKVIMSDNKALVNENEIFNKYIFD